MDVFAVGGVSGAGGGARTSTRRRGSRLSVAARTGARPGSSRRRAQCSTRKGQLQLDLDTPASDGRPYQYTFEGDVEDVSRQHIAGRASTLVHPAPWYIGLQRPSLFVSQKDGLNTAVVAVSPRGTAAPGVPVERRSSKCSTTACAAPKATASTRGRRRATRRRSARYTVTSAVEPVPLSVPLKNGGSYVLRATATQGAYKAITQMPFYALGAGYTAWERYDHNRIDLVPEQETYKPGDTARLMIKSPWEQATALLTVEREGIRSHSTVRLTSTQQTVTVPIPPADIPNVFVSVLLIKGRTTKDIAPERHERPRQTGVPARLREVECRGRVKATVGRGEGRTRKNSGRRGPRKSTCS